MLNISPRTLALLAGFTSAALLLAALAFQAFGYRPCELCILQRWPHLAAALIAGMLLWGDHPILRWAGTLAAMLATAFAIYHTGVESGWWAGPQDCAGGIGNMATLSTEDLMQRLQTAQVVRCDQPAWVFLGISMAGWNAMISAVLSVAWLRAASGRGIRI